MAYKQIDRLVKELEKNTMKNRYRCVLCKQPTSIDGSYSHSGHRLVCHSCLWTRFDGNIVTLSRWQNDGD